VVARDANRPERCQRAVLALERQRGDLADARAKDGRLEAIGDRHGLLVLLAVYTGGAGALAGGGLHDRGEVGLDSVWVW